MLGLIPEANNWPDFKGPSTALVILTELSFFLFLAIRQCVWNFLECWRWQNFLHLFLGKYVDIYLGLDALTHFWYRYLAFTALILRIFCKFLHRNARDKIVNFLTTYMKRDTHIILESVTLAHYLTKISWKQHVMKTKLGCNFFSVKIKQFD